MVNCKIFKYSPKKTVVLKQCLINLKTGPLWVWSFVSQLLEPEIRNTDRERTNPNRSPSMLHQEPYPVYSASQPSLAAFNKVDTIILNMEPDQIAPQDSLEYMIVPGKDLDHIPRWEGYVEKESNFTEQVFLLCNLPKYIK